MCPLMRAVGIAQSMIQHFPIMCEVPSYSVCNTDTHTHDVDTSYSPMYLGIGHSDWHLHLDHKEGKGRGRRMGKDAIRSKL